MVEYNINNVVDFFNSDIDMGVAMKVGRFCAIVADKSDKPIGDVKKILRVANKCVWNSLYESIKLMEEQDILEVYFCTT